MTYNEMATIVAHYMGDPTSIPFREEAKRLINVWRSRLIRETLEKNPLDRKYFVATIYRDLVASDRPSCPVVPASCSILRTSTMLPPPLRANSIFYDFVGNSDRTISYPVIDTSMIPYYSYGKYTGKNPYIIPQGGYLYLINEKMLKCLLITGIFDSLNIDDCHDDNEYPAPWDIQQKIIELLKNEVRALPNIKDTEINLTDDATTAGSNTRS